MLPTSPRVAARSTCSSCTTPASRTATRVSCGVMLIRISSGGTGRRLPNANASPHQERGGLGQRQADHPRKAAFEFCHEKRRAPLDRVAAGLVQRFVAGAVAFDLL